MLLRNSAIAVIRPLVRFDCYGKGKVPVNSVVFQTKSSSISGDQMVTWRQLTNILTAKSSFLMASATFAEKQVERLRWWAPNRLAYISLHDPRVAERYPDLTHDALMKEMYLIDSEGNRHGGAHAVRYLTRKSPRMWIFAPLMHLPYSMWFWCWLYALVAKYRYRIAGKSNDCDSDACEIHFHR